MTARRVVGVLLLLLGMSVVAAPVAAAHAGPTNDRPVLGQVQPPVDGLEVRLHDRARIEVENHTNRKVLVLGYSGEPYLRLERRSVYVNERSPSTYLNQTFNPRQVPDGYDAGAPPEWKRLATKKDGVRWHDHRLHLGPSASPPARWTVDLLVGDEPVTVVGDFVTDDPPAQWPWWLLGLAGAVVMVVAVKRTPNHREVFFGGVAVVFLATQTVALGAGGVVPVVAALVAVPAAAAVWFLRAYPVGGLAGALAVGAGLTGLSDLRFAHMAVAAGDGVFRGAVVLSIGVGLGLMAAAALVVTELSRPADR